VIKRKFLISCLALVVLWLSSSLFSLVEISSVSASPDKLKWSIVDTPSEEGNAVVSPSEISAFVLGSDDETFYAIDIPHKKVYKSTDGGITWENTLESALEDEGATLSVWDIAVAPDDPGLVAVVADNRTRVYVSHNGGKKWDAISMPSLGGTLISDIAISKEYGSGSRDIAMGTRNPDGSPNGNVWVMELAPFATWKSAGLNADVSSIAFSPGYGSDRTILAIASNSTGSYLCVRHRVGDTWVEVIPPVEISEVSGNSPKEDQIIVSDLALASEDYSKDRWIVYAGYYSETDVDDAYRIKYEKGGAEVSRLKIKQGDKVSLASIDYSSGKLMAGEVLGEADSASALIHICSNPEERVPTWKEPTKPPTGGAISGRANAQIVWSPNGRQLYCGTSTNHVESAADWIDMTLPAGPWRGEACDESAFSVSISKDSGDTWNQLSFIDTQMRRLCDYALSVATEDTETVYYLYLASVSSGFASIWQNESKTLETLGKTWQRVLCFDNKTNDIILRLSTKEGKQRLFLAVRDTDDARYFYKDDQGEWHWKEVWDCPHITDLAVVNNEKFYILDGNLVNICAWNEKMWGGIWEWQRDIDTGLLSGYIIAISSKNYVFVAEDEDGEGKIAYSTNGGVTFKLTEIVPEPGNMQVTLDDEFDTNRFIYATSDSDLSKIYRWTVEGSTSWKDLKPPHPSFHSLAHKGGALYGAYGNRQGVARTLIPHLETVTPSDWDSLTAGLVSGTVFKSGTLRALSNKAVDLWAIDDRDYDFKAKMGCLWVYSDTFVLQTPWPTSPALGEFITCDPCNCQPVIFCFQWRKLPSAEKYELWLARDEKFDAIIATEENITPADSENPAWCPPANWLVLVCGRTYYWKVRACQSTEGETIHSRWSPPMSFTVKECSLTQQGVHTAPILKVPSSGNQDVSRSPGFSWVGFPGTEKYEFILARDASLSQIVIKEQVPTSAYQYSDTLDWGTTYFWQVKAVAPVPSEPAINTFTVMSEPRVAPPPAAKPPLPVTPFWVWLVIGILTLLIILVIALCLFRR